MATSIVKKPQVNITFKKKEMDMYEYLKTKSSPGNFIKDLVRSHMSGVYIPPDTQAFKQEKTKEEIDSSKLDTVVEDEIVNGLDDISMFMEEFQ